MTPEPAPPPSRGSEPGPDGADPGEQPLPRETQPGERYGPVEIARYVKDDGRALLLYSDIARRDQA